MRLHNAIRSAVGLIQSARKALGEDSDPQWGIERVGETLTPTMNLWGQPEWDFLRGSVLAMGRQFVTGVAGELSCVTLANETSDRLVVVDRIELFSTTLSAVRIGFMPNIPAGATLTQMQRTYRDGRWAARPPLLNIYGETHVGTAITQGWYECVQQASVPKIITGPWIISPRDFSGPLVADVLLIEQQVAALTLTFGVVWRERKLFDSERPQP